MTLYELTNEFQQLLDIATDETIDQQTLKDTIEIVGMEIEDKAEGYAKVIRQLEGNISAIEAEEERLAGMKKRAKNNISALKYNLTNAMVITGKTKFKTPLFSFNIQRNTPSLEIIDESKIPAEFWLNQDPKLDRRALLAYVKEHEVDGVAIKQTESLRIR